jgi:hypothetical protein
MGRKLTVYMIDGTEYGPRIAEIGNWVGKALYSPRAAISKVLHRPEFGRPGVYFLKSPPNSDSFAERVYIGEAENVGVRINQHLSDPNKEFDELVFFTSNDHLLTKTQIKYLESRTVQQAHEAKSAEIVNGNNPSIPSLHEADVSDMEFFLEQMKLILPIMGFKFLISAVAKLPIEKTEAEITISDTYSIKSPSFQAFMFETEQGFIVKKGSQANKVLSNSIGGTYKRLRAKLISSGILVDRPEYLEFIEDAVFSSPSAASNVILGRQSAGPIEWVNSSNKTYKEVNEVAN